MCSEKFRWILTFVNTIEAEFIITIIMFSSLFVQGERLRHLLNYSMSFKSHAGKISQLKGGIFLHYKWVFMNFWTTKIKLTHCNTCEARWKELFLSRWPTQYFFLKYCSRLSAFMRINKQTLLLHESFAKYVTLIFKD